LRHAAVFVSLVSFSLEKPMASGTVTLRVSLDKTVYRDIVISGDANLYKLAQVINEVFGFDFDHAFGFYDNLKNPYRSKEVYELFTDMEEDPNEGARSVKKSKVIDAFPAVKKTMIFLFDYGDEWLFQVKRLDAETRAVPKSFWKLLKSEGEAPEQYPDYEDEDDGIPFHEKYELVDMGGIKLAKLREKK
jgi:hypothetical protein